MTDIYTALYNARNGNGAVYAQDASGEWSHIIAAQETMRGLFACSDGRWFNPQMWEVRS